MNPAMEIVRTLRALRWRMAAGDFIRATVRTTMFFFALLVLLTSVAWWRGEFRPNLEGIPFVLGWPVALGLLAAFVMVVLRFPRLERVAKTIDWAGATNDRFSTALEFAGKAAPTDFESLAMQEAGRYAKERDLRTFLPVRVPRELPWLIVPLAMLALLWRDALVSNAERDRLVAAQTAEISGTVEQLERIASALEKKTDAGDAKNIRELTERLKQSAAVMRATAAEGGDAKKAALRELALLESLVEQLRRPEAPTESELKALADALSQHEQAREAARDIRDGNLAAAAKKLEAISDGNEDAAEAVSRTLQRALDHLAEQRERSSKRLEELRREAAESGQRQLVKQIAKLLEELQGQGKVTEQKSGENGPSQPGGKQITDDELKKLLGALQALKNDQQGADPAGAQAADGAKDGQSAIAMLDFQSNRDVPGGGKMPGGSPGSEKDSGTTENPFGAASAAAEDAVSKTRLTGQLGEGESLAVLVPGIASGDEKATRRYKELYEAAAGYAADAVAQEEIPLGARFLVRRYFEAIRPRQ